MKENEEIQPNWNVIYLMVIGFLVFQILVYSSITALLT